MATVWVDVIIGSIVHGDLWELNGGPIAKHIDALGIDVVRSSN